MCATHVACVGNALFDVVYSDSDHYNHVVSRHTRMHFQKNVISPCISVNSVLYR